MSDAVTDGVRTLAGRYEIGALLGRGGMAEVHEGLDTRLNRRVAIKLLRPSLATDPAFRTRFRQEAQAAARMAHPTIVRVFDAGEETVRGADGHDVQLPFIVMERIEGKLLSDLIANGPVPADEAARIVTGILTALEYSHRAGVVHRDIKPGNVMLTPNGQVKVMDFGIARAISESSANVAQTSAVLGTASYFSPEQARGESVDARTDLYSTGVVLYELLTGRTPFRADSPVAVAYQHVSELPTPPNAVNPTVSPAMSAVVLHALAKDRFERFQSAADFKADLEVAAGGKVPDRAPGDDDFNATLFGVNPNSTAASEATLRRLANDENRPVRTQSRPPVAWIWGGIAVMVVVIVAAMVWVFNLSPGEYVGAGTAVKVPDVVGQQADAGMQVLRDAGLRPTRVDRPDDKVDAGFIVSTSIVAGTTVSPNETLEVVVSSGPPKTALPVLTNAAEADAIAKIKELGLVYGQSNSSYSPNVPAGYVIAATIGDDPAPVTSPVNVEAGTIVNLIVSNGMVQVDDLTGKPVPDAQSYLQGLQLTWKLRPESPAGCTPQTVLAQSAKGDVPQRSTIELSYCQPPPS
ncbi:Stk1 family PASTA domain-containing Ser/Thr kinase [Protaetiibacter larvae]|uniref:non-specific serine/threonine protein kinase n=1 Tax=Protaetiibacter larvae TaxID=2592654 RepID=A0A5C1Y594_9MICO|nr:Stk1 family PASTA domain-containing Ser/Thr kinase [Protaetiibacter larvae]QEO09064.1 Stk1 family PASTA domain-containing Ser/Thr kinase [Protaetiibacter larvae]